MTIIPRGSDSTEGLESKNDILQRISPFFAVKNTKYGGKGCFNYEPIPVGTTVLISRNPLSSTIGKDFKKEVCNFCFQYNEGANMKHKLGLEKFNQYLYFCSPQCGERFQSMDPHKIYSKTLLTLDLQYNNGLKKKEEDFEDPELSEDLVTKLSEAELLELIEVKWEQVDQWDEDINRLKPTKWIQRIPRISEAEYLEVKYILGVLYQQYMNQNGSVTNKYLQDTTTEESFALEQQLFDQLQSNETSKVLKYPHLLQSYINVYKYVKLTSPPQFQKFISSSQIRSIIGKNLTNAFGIWSLNVTGNKEFFGFGVYPSASFFNHSCSPNIIKKRIGKELHFITLKDITEHDELCIDYGSYLNEPVNYRRQQLSEWFFDCACDRCIKELAN